ncbi:MAG: hypothetical protein RL454_1195, partial [Actinomycetota bacterium]
MESNEREYMREVFQNQLSDVQGRLVEMAESVTTIMEKASKAFLNSDVALADEAIALAEANENRALALDEIVIRVLAKQSPVARDLRILVSALRISASLERMGALAGHIAAIARYRYPGTAVPEALRDTFLEMGRLDVELGRRVTTLLKNTDVNLAREIQAEDARVDDRPTREQQRGREVAVDPTEPFGLAEQVEAEGVLGIDQRLRL